MVGSSNARRLRGIPLSPTAPTDGQGLTFDAASGLWVPTTLSGGGGGNVNGQASSVDSEIALFSGTGGKTIKRATGTGFVKVVNGVAQAPAATVGSSEISPLVIQYATVLVTAAQIKSAVASPTTIIAAPGAGFMIDLFYTTAILLYGTASYTAGDTQFGLYYGSSATTNGLAALLGNSAGFMHTAGASSRVLISTNAAFGSYGFLTDAANAAIVLASPTTEFATGDSTMRLHIAYRVLPTT